MAKKYYVNESTLSSIANFIRNNGTRTGTIKPSEFAGLLSQLHRSDYYYEEPADKSTVRSWATYIQIPSGTTVSFESKSSNFSLDNCNFENINLNLSGSTSQKLSCAKCYNLKTLNISGKTSLSLIESSNGFNNCTSLEEINFTDGGGFTFNESYGSLRPVTLGFRYCSSLKEIPLSSSNIKLAKGYQYFLMCSKLEGFKVNDSYPDISITIYNSNNTIGLFSNCSYLSKNKIKLTAASMSSVDLQTTFANCQKLKEVELNLSNISIILMNNYTFNNCYKMTKLTLKGIYASQSITTSSNTFSNCGRDCLQSEGAYADGIPYVYVESIEAQTKVLSLEGIPSTWSTNNVVVMSS